MSQINKNGTLTMRVVCAILFLVFTFLYLYEYQSDILAVTQHVLSDGATHYNRTIGAVLITLVLWLIQLGVYTFTGLSRRGHALTYFPSLLLLGILTDVDPDISQSNYLGNWLWGFPLLMIVYGFVVWVVRQLEPMELPQTTSGLFSRMTWINLLQMVVMALITCAIGCPDTLFHYRMRAENDILSDDFYSASQVGKDYLRTDSSMTLLRIWSLAKEGKLPEKLFDYSLVGNSDAMLPNGRTVKLMMVPEKKFYADFGVVFTEKMKPIEYLETVNKTKYASKYSHDWLLCAYLLDRNIDAFVRTLPKYYKLNGHLPQAYREALILYMHVRRNPVVQYHQAVGEADYEDFRSQYLNTKNPQERYSVLRDNYGKTYWFYYYFRDSALH